MEYFLGTFGRLSESYFSVKFPAVWIFLPPRQSSQLPHCTILDYVSCVSGQNGLEDEVFGGLGGWFRGLRV